ncbi:MAG: carbohydrate binding family 9 domain-containing protein [Flavobacteriaceae bacterium]|nr:carbohydrate binding family 9 domain-containing protein [Flavobacteriaceae bacterium]
MSRIFSLLLITFLCSNQLSAQIGKDRKKIKTTRVSNAPKIDGVLDDEAWKNAEIAKDFFVFRPDNGKKAPKTHQTEVKVIYDDDAIYISANMLDPDPSKIPMEFTNRDNFGQSDFFLVTINPNDDGQNPFEFIVMSTGSQAESKVSEGNEDFSWNAVWVSAAKINGTGWAVEMKIPYRALRFSNQEVQSWGFNFHRNVKNENAQYTWNWIDNTQGTWTQYDGLIEDFKNIEPPTRLAFYPYTSGTVNTFDGNSETSGSIGMDVQYGLTENFTLDATLIPDFGQVAFDNVSLNLGPFEQVFNEQRQFFIEGTELFGKGNLFFSRRIGSRPTDFSAVNNDLAANEEIIDNPDAVKMLNAVKVSGRTKKGLGIGFFNAITEKTEATIRNTVTGETRKRVTEPFANYNIIVLDQTFNKNSSVTFINTNVTRDGSFRDANVTGLLWHVRTKNSKFFADGSFKQSNVIENGKTTTGSTFDLSIAKAAGNWRWETGYNFEDKNYNPNDLGVLFSNNEQTFYGNVSYRILQPKGNVNNFRVNSWYNINYLHDSGTYTGNNAGVNIFAELKNRLSFGGNVNGNFGKQYDFFEPRQGTTSGVFFIRPTRLTVNGWMSTDFRKKFAFDVNFFKSSFFNHPRDAFGFNFSPRYRFSNQLSFSYGFGFNKTNNDQGYLDQVGNEIIFGQRDRKTFNNTVSAKYNFSIKSSLSLTFRHNWSDVSYGSRFFSLRPDGYLGVNTTYTENRDINFNSWNLDLNYFWQFAPGSQLIAFYRNSIFSVNNNTGQDFFTNIDNLFNEPKQHIFSLRLVYFIDYNNLKNIF